MRVVRATLYPGGEVISVGDDFQMITHLTGLFNEVEGAIHAHADDNTIFEIAQNFRGPMRQVHRAEWHL